MRSAVALADHEVLVSATLVDEQASIERALGLRALPPARFREPIPIERNRVTFRPRRSPRSRRRLALFTGALAVTSLAIAGWNAYWLAGPLERAVLSLFG